jgi:endonuclease IV
MDFSHLYARTGKYNSYEEMMEVLDKLLKQELGARCIKQYAYSCFRY